MLRKPTTLAAASVAVLLVPATASAHVSFHPNAIPAGSFPTFTIRVPNEQSKGNITSVRIQLPAGVLYASGEPPAGWSFSSKSKKLAKPITTDDGTVTSEITEIDFTGGKTPPGEMVQLAVAMNVPDSAKEGDELTFPAIQTYSTGEVVRWIDTGEGAEHPAPTVDITAAGGPLLDVTGGDAGPPAKLPSELGGDGSSSEAAPAKESDSRSSDTLAIIALIVGAAGLLVGGAGFARGRQTA